MEETSLNKDFDLKKEKGLCSKSYLLLSRNKNKKKQPEMILSL